MREETRSCAYQHILRGATEPRDADGDAPFSRLTNAFSRKLEKHLHMLSPCFMHDNFVRIHSTLRVTPAMAVGIARALHPARHGVDRRLDRRADA